MSAGWYVVKFKNEKNIIEVIPSNWIKNFEACFWPLKYGSIKLQSAIKNRANPEKDWKLYTIKVICNKMFTVYKDASKFANETLAQSSSESEQLTAKKTSTKRKKKNKQIDCSSGPSSDEKDNELPPFPKFKKNDSKETESSIDVSHNIECSLNDDLNVVSNENQNIFVIDDDDNQNIDLSDGFRCIISNNQNCVSSDESFTVIDNNDIGVSNGSDNLPSVSGNKNQNYNFPEVETQILRQLITLNARCKEQGDYLHTIMMVVNNIQEKQDKQTSSIAVSSATNDELENVCAMLPISNELSLTNFKETLINNKTLYDKMVKMLALLGGSNFKESVRRILRKLITNDYAKSFSYTGHKNNKTALNNTILASLLTKAIHSSTNNAGTTVKQIELVASIWLTKANERCKQAAEVPL